VHPFATALGVPFTFDSQNAPPRDQVFHALFAAIGTQKRPLVLVAEDLHWSDEASLDFVRFLGRRIEGLPVLLIATYRNDEIGLNHPLQRILGDLATAPGLQRLTLAPLSEGAVGDLAATTGLDAAELYRSTGGNPFYVTEALATGEKAVPPTVADAVLARAARLTPPAREVLNSAAVIGGRVDPDLLLAVAGPVLDEIDECVGRGLLKVDGDTLIFRHQIARDAIYASIIPPRRRLLHGRTLAVLRGRPDRERHLAQLAHHAEFAGDRAQTFEFALAAAHQAAAARAHLEAEAQYARALTVADQVAPAELASLCERWSYECYLTNQINSAISGRQRALDIWRELNEPLRVGENLRWLSRLNWFIGRNEEAGAAAAASLEVLDALPAGSQLAWAYSNMAQLRMLADELDGAVRWGEQAIALAERLGEREILAHALNNVGAALLVRSDERGRAMLERSLQIALDDGYEEHVARAWTNLGSQSVRSFDLDRAKRYLDDGIAFSTQHDLDAWSIYMSGWLATLHLYRADWDAAESVCAMILRQPRSVPVNLIVALTTLGLLRTRRGDPESMACLEHALALAEPTGEAQRLGPVHLARAEAAWHSGARDDMAAYARAALACAGTSNERWLRSEAIYWLWHAGVGVDLPDDLTEPIAREIAGDPVGAAAAWEALGCPFEAARALLASDREENIRCALATFDRLGAGPAAAMAMDRLRKLGIRAPRAATRSHPAGLTSREAEILDLISAGCTNRQIAEQLYLSPKTVEHHVSAILGKLGVRSRQEAERMVADLHRQRKPTA
jgi:DNA-binding CsgD family transcriptional regulator